MRTLWLAALALVAVVLTLVVRAPERRTGMEAVSGTRLVRVSKPAVRTIAVVLGPGRLAATRTPAGWRVDDRPASPELGRALDDLLATLADLRAIDAFRTDAQTGFDLDPPRGVVEVTTAHTRHRLALGGLNGGGTAIYARRDGDRRTFLVGTYLLSQLERALRQHDREMAGGGGSAP